MARLKEPCKICSEHRDYIRKVKVVMREFNDNKGYNDAARKLGLDRKAEWHAHVIKSPACRDRIIDDYFGSM